MRRMLGGLLNGCGILIAGTTGLCAAIIVLGSSSSKAPWRMFTDTLQATGVPMAIGLVLIIAGQALIRSSRDDRSE